MNPPITVCRRANPLNSPSSRPNMKHNSYDKRRTARGTLSISGLLTGISVASSHLVSHRITEWFGLEGTSKITYFQPLCRGQGCQPLHQVAQGPIHGRGHLQEQGNPSSGQQCQCCIALSEKNSSLTSNLNLPSSLNCSSLSSHHLPV